MGNLRDIITAQAKDTLGFSEAKDKESFLTGVSVAISLMEIHYKNEIEGLQNKVKLFNKMYEDSTKDLKTLAAILKKYTDE